MTTRIAMWSGPRNISTAMMRSWGNRPDTGVCDEPLYAHYLWATGRRHPGAEEVMAHHETDWRKVIPALTGEAPGGRAIFYQKHMAHHVLPQIDRAWLGQVTNCFLIRALTRGVKVTSGMDPRLNQSGPTLIVLAEHKPPVYDSCIVQKAGAGLTLITSSVRRFPPDCLDPKIHHCNLIQSILAKIEANNAGADDALMLDTRGFVAETNATHVFIVDEGIVATSRLVACPEGITRATVLELCAANGIPSAERDLSLTEVYRASEMFCSGTMGELAAVTRVDGRPIGDGRVGPTTVRLTELFRQRTAREGTEVVR